MSFSRPIFGKNVGSPSPLCRPHSTCPPPDSQQPPRGQITGTSPSSMSPCPPPINWPNRRLNPALRRQLCPSAAPGVLCGSRSNPANLHNDEALQCGLGLRRVGKKYALSFGEAHRRLGAAREEWGSWRVGGRGEEPAARPPRTAQLCRPLSLCPAGPAKEALPRAVNQQEEGSECQLQTRAGQTQVIVTATHWPADLGRATDLSNLSRARQGSPQSTASKAQTESRKRQPLSR